MGIGAGMTRAAGWGRPLLLGLGLAVALAAAASPAARAGLMGHDLLSGALLTLAALVLLPARAFWLAPLLGGGALALLRWASAQKVAAVGLPLAYLDLVNVAAAPRAFLGAVGLRGGGAALAALAAAAALGLLLLAARAARRASPRRIGLRLAEAGVVAAAALFALDAAARTLRDDLPRLFPAIEPELWQPTGQQSLARAVGPLEYVALTRLLGDGEAAGLRAADAPPLPAEAVRAAAAGLFGALPRPALPPNLVMVHAESTFDPNAIFRLAAPVDLPLWTAGPETRLLAPLRVNVVGGGSWVTEFEVLTGVDSRGFGYQGFYTHQTIGPAVRAGFPSWLAARGYDTAAYYTEGAAWFGVGEAFRHYGVAAFHDAPSIGLAADWSDDDLAIVRKDLAAGLLAGGDRPVFAFVSTLSNHGPHPCRDDPDPADAAVRFAGAAGPGQACALAEYVRRARITAAAVETILARLRALERETGRPWAVLVYGDHQPWSFTDGAYSVAGGEARDAAMAPFAPLRRGDNARITFVHVLSSVPGALAAPGDAPLPVTLVPTLLSAYAAAGWDDLYLPVNALAYGTCGADVRAPGCPLARDLDLWGRAAILGPP